MKEAKTFAQGTELRKITVQGIELELEVNEHVFSPSVNGSFYAESIKVNAGETVIDIGTGSGALGIFAAKAGAIVSATDIDRYAVEIASRNALLNKVEIEFSQGTLFAASGKSQCFFRQTLSSAMTQRQRVLHCSSRWLVSMSHGNQ